MLFHFFGKLRLGKSSNAEEQMSREAGEQEKAEGQHEFRILNSAMLGVRPARRF